MSNKGIKKLNKNTEINEIIKLLTNLLQCQKKIH
jgi:hypothetical protein